MISLHPTDLDVASPNALYAAAIARRFAQRRSWAATRVVCTPMVVAPAALVVLCVYALLVLTGAGPDSWQVRQCSDTNLRPRACAFAVPASATHRSDSDARS